MREIHQQIAYLELRYFSTETLFTYIGPRRSLKIASSKEPFIHKSLNLKTRFKRFTHRLSILFLSGLCIVTEHLQ